MGQWGSQRAHRLPQRCASRFFSRSRALGRATLWRRHTTHNKSRSDHSRHACGGTTQSLKPLTYYVREKRGETPAPRARAHTAATPRARGQALRGRAGGPAHATPHAPARAESLHGRHDDMPYAPVRYARTTMRSRAASPASLPAHTPRPLLTHATYWSSSALGAEVDALLLEGFTRDVACHTPRPTTSRCARTRPPLPRRASRARGVAGRGARGQAG